MASLTESEPYQITWLIRRLFRALAQKSDENLAGLGISASERAAMEFLHPDRELTVPELADRHDVSRQHIQVSVNSLLEKKLVLTRPNPRHKRSPVLALSVRGRKLFETVLQRDAESITALFANVSGNSAQQTRLTLQTLLDELKGG